MQFAKKKLIVAVLFLALAVFPHMVHAATGSARYGSDDNFTTGGWSEFDIGGNTLNCSVVLLPYGNRTMSNAIGSFDPFNTSVLSTGRNPMTIILNQTHLQVSADTFRCFFQLYIYDNTGGTAETEDYGYTFDALGASSAVVDISSEYNTTGIGDGSRINLAYGGGRRWDITADIRGVGTNGNNRLTSHLGIAPEMKGITLAPLINLFQNQTINLTNYSGRIASDTQENIVAFNTSIVRQSNSATILDNVRHVVSSSNPQRNMTKQLINFSIAPTLNEQYYLVFKTWETTSNENSVVHSRFSNRSDNATAGGFSPKTVLFNITSKLSCAGSTEFSVYNLGESSWASGTLTDANGVLYNVSNVQYSLLFRNASSSIDEFTNASWVISSVGGFNRTFTIPTNADALFTRQGQPFNVIVVVNNTAKTEMLNCTYGSVSSPAFSVSNLYTVVTTFLNTGKVYFGNAYRILTNITLARGDPAANIPYNVTIYRTDGTYRYTYNGTTNSSGLNLNTDQYAIMPTGTRTANASVYTALANNNTGNSTNGSITVAEKAGKDPLTVDCWDCANANTGDAVRLTAHQRDLDGMTITGSSVFFNVTQLIGGTATTTGTGTEVLGTGDYEFVYTPATAGLYRVIANVSYQGTWYNHSITFRVKDDLTTTLAAIMAGQAGNFSALNQNMNSNFTSANTSRNQQYNNVIAGQTSINDTQNSYNTKNNANWQGNFTAVLNNQTTIYNYLTTVWNDIIARLASLNTNLQGNSSAIIANDNSLNISRNQQFLNLSATLSSLNVNVDLSKVYDNETRIFNALIFANASLHGAIASNFTNTNSLISQTDADVLSVNATQTSYFNTVYGYLTGTVTTLLNSISSKIDALNANIAGNFTNTNNLIASINGSGGGSVNASSVWNYIFFQDNKTAQQNLFEARMFS